MEIERDLTCRLDAYTGTPSLAVSIRIRVFGTKATESILEGLVLGGKVLIKSIEGKHGIPEDKK